MIRPGTIKISILFIFLTNIVIGQDETQPVSPRLENVTVEPATGFTTITWQLSPSADVESYVVYTFTDNTAFAVDTVRSPYSTEYVHTGSAARYMSVTYVVAAIDSSRNISPLSNSLSTIYVSFVNDSCNFRVTLSWTDYINPLYPADGYELWLKRGTDPTVLLEALPVSQRSYTFSGYAASTEYCFYIRATAANAGLSSSNSICLLSGSETPPRWTITHAVFIQDQVFGISGSYDNDTDIDTYIAEVFNQSTTSWITTASASGINGNVTINTGVTDTTRVSLYRISALNNCGQAVTPSSPVRNIVLSSAAGGTLINLKWNNPFPQRPAYFKVWRNIGSGWEEVAGQVADTSWSDDYASFASDVSSPVIAYYVTALDQEASAGSPECRSSMSLVFAVENIYVANAFTPDDNGINDLFTPVMTFIPVEYELTIFSRTGVILFRTTSPGTGWDGRHNDKPMPPGAYLWSLRLTTPSGKDERRTGTVTILP
ncbi:MAG: gliding motility-associated C-terminal domain-containing protein [Bacteroidales bacterium]|jgi:gliding motility-associated-like protein|nr:gliding motility-associated C-terminal domain-containing protein [Bacteroidales bacterium]